MIPTRSTTDVGATPEVLAASMDDYTNFHGMLCSTGATQRCIQSFDGGTVLFMPFHYTKENLERYDFSGGKLKLFGYYWLVIVSFTGLSTLLGKTTFRTARQYSLEDMKQADDGQVVSEYNPQLRVEPFVLEYCRRYTGAKSLHLHRQFEYHFRLVSIEVIMLHFLCDQGRLHLVEVYQVQNMFARMVLAVIRWVKQAFRRLSGDAKKRQ